MIRTRVASRCSGRYGILSSLSPYADRTPEYVLEHRLGERTSPGLRERQGGRGSGSEGAMRKAAKKSDRPQLWVGHVVWRGKDVPGAAALLRGLGMRARAHPDPNGDPRAPGPPPPRGGAAGPAPGQVALGGAAPGAPPGVWPARGLRAPPTAGGAIHNSFTTPARGGRAVRVNNPPVGGVVWVARGGPPPAESV